MEAAVVGYPHPVKGEDLYAYVILNREDNHNEDTIRSELKQIVRSEIGPIAVPGKIQFVEEMPKNRSGKILRRVLRKIASGDRGELDAVVMGTLANPDSVDAINDKRIV